MQRIRSLIILVAVYLDNKGKKKSPEKALGVGEIIRIPAAFGDFLGRKGDGEPGVKTVWEGCRKLLNYIEASELVNRVKSYV
ncbi:MAG: hypothetical protein KUG80_04210 [Gammaproteobacteria bacterium]|nr:hypothetical protein [Gammaproteobacteria bacterium]